MQIQVNTSNGVENKETLERWADGEIRAGFARFASDVTRVEVHMADENSAKGGAGDKRCTLEARVAGHPPVAVTQHAPTLDEAFRGAEAKLKHALDHALGKQRQHRDHSSIRNGSGGLSAG